MRPPIGRASGRRNLPDAPSRRMAGVWLAYGWRMIFYQIFKALALPVILTYQAILGRAGP